MSREIIKEFIDGITSYFYIDNNSGMHIYHKEDGHAIEYPDGRKDWYFNGLRHREDGPAIEQIDGNKFWYRYGKYHREDGPAIEWSDRCGGKKEFWKYGIRYNEDGSKYIYPQSIIDKENADDRI